MRKAMSRTETLMKRGLSQDEAIKALIFYDQGLRWIKNIDYDKQLQEEMDWFVNILIDKPHNKLKNFIEFVRDKYFATDDEKVNDEEFNRRWYGGYELLIK